MCIRDRDYFIKGQVYPDANSTSFDFGLNTTSLAKREVVALGNCNACHVRFQMHEGQFKTPELCVCLLYTSDAADERSSVDLGGRRIIKKKKKSNLTRHTSSSIYS